MKPKILVLLILILCFSNSNAQNIWETKTDSLALISRNKADKVLGWLDYHNTPKLLYSLEDKYYYVIIKATSFNREYYIELNDIGNIDKVRYIPPLQPQNKQQRKLQKQYQKLLSEAEPIFDLGKYHTNFITKIPNAEHTNGKYSYFIVKNIDSKRYGEYRLSAVTLPLPIHTSLWAYLVRRLSDEIKQ